eukprot:TRINITY_DN4960_c0_g1_i2.p1 TRINITY_DN4960_c0_g1~~TRINITY_DN4960_c0_g1_i2.p1  ORF type:complete len:101 (-),score=13.44 TRINITY_DN4960_c0_g1_i2:771-1073(-)
MLRKFNLIEILEHVQELSDIQDRLVVECIKRDITKGNSVSQFVPRRWEEQLRLVSKYRSQPLEDNFHLVQNTLCAIGLGGHFLGFILDGSYKTTLCTHLL